MRLSLRTLLAFEDNVFDVEQHRRLEQLLPADKNAEATLRRIRSIVRNPSLGVPGLVDHQEELDPNYVAEYLDHQMSGSVQEKFEAYCLSADKYLAEIASVHHILSNVLGEPARTSRECRFRCYDVMLADTLTPPSPGTQPPAPSVVSKPPVHFQPYETPPVPKADKPATHSFFAPLWNRLFPTKSAPAAPVIPAEPVEKKPPFWTFTILGLFICALLLGWQQIEKQRLAKIGQDTINREPETVSREPETVSPEFSAAVSPENPIIVTPPPPKTITTTEENSFVEHDIASEAAEHPDDVCGNAPFAEEQQTGASESLVPLARLDSIEPVEQVAYAAESFTSFPIAPAESAFVAVSDVLPVEPARFEPFVPEDLPSENAENSHAPENNASEELPTEPGAELIVAFQPITPSPITEPELSVCQDVLPPISVASWQPAETSNEPAAPIVQAVSVAQPPVSAGVVPQPAPSPPTISQMSAVTIVPRAVGRAVQTHPSDLIFSAASAGAAWRLSPLPFDLNGDQYLLTTAPFRGTFELAAGFRIEMIGDTKLCLLPPDASGMSGIFVDYGRIIVHPLIANQPLRIETEKARGTAGFTGTESILFIDTFAEVSEPSNGTRPPEEQKPQTSPILGFVPKNGERIFWQSVSQPQPFYANSQGCVLLQSERYRFAEIRLPNWIGAMPAAQEDRMLAEVCRQSFAEAQGDGERALTQLIRSESPAVRTLGLRLWGDLGRFDVPIAVMAEGRQGEEKICHVLHQYFEEVMRRDEETVQRLADAIQIVKEAQRN